MTASTTQLTLFNDALSLLGLRSLSATSDATEPARVLNALWTQTRDYCLEQARWRFAERQATLSVAAGQVASEPAYGLLYAYAKPADFVTLNSIASDATFTTPIPDLHERGGYWYTNTPTNIYIQYTSRHTDFGYDLTLWPETFIQFYIHYLALRAAPRLAPSLLGGVPIAGATPQEGPQVPRNILQIGMQNALDNARVYDIVEGPSTFLPEGTTTQLSLFNDTLDLLGLPHLVTVTDAGPTARTLNNLWVQAKDYCLEQARWRFAERQATLSVAAGQVASEPAYGLDYAYAKPADFVTLNAIASDATLDTPLTTLHERGGYWYTDTPDNVYIQYISNHTDFGYDLTLWPETFVQLFINYLALKAAPSIARHLLQGGEGEQGSVFATLTENMNQALAKAREYDIVEGPSTFLPGGVTSQLSIFNNAMWMLGGRNLVKLSDAGEAPRTLLQLWDRAKEYCLQQGHWKFAEREVKLDTPSVVEVPTYGLRNAYDKPTDFVRVNQISADEYFNSPISNIHDRGDYIYADLNPIYLRYVSRDSSHGGDLTRWPETFTLFVTLYLATLAAPYLAPERKMDLIVAPGNIGLEEAKMNALGKDAVEGPTQFLPEGRWAASRSPRGVNRGRNSRTSLYGD